MERSVESFSLQQQAHKDCLLFPRLHRKATSPSRGPLYPGPLYSGPPSLTTIPGLFSKQPGGTPPKQCSVNSHSRAPTMRTPISRNTPRHVTYRAHARLRLHPQNIKGCWFKFACFPFRASWHFHRSRMSFLTGNFTLCS